MFKTRIIQRLIVLLLVFALVVVGPFSFTVIKQVQKLIEQEEALNRSGSPGEMHFHKEFTPRLVEQMVPFTFYILIMSFLLSIFFLRKMLISLKNLREGSRAMRDGNLDVRLDVLTEDELGDVTKAFNDMAAALQTKTQELVQKDVYVNAMLDPLWFVDQEDRIRDINPAFTRLFGHTREDVIGASVYDFLDEKNSMIMRTQLEEKREKGIASIYELNILAKSGASVPVLVSGSPIFSGDQVIGKIGVLKDFREQSNLRAELQNSLEYIETIMNSIPEELIVIDRSYKIIMANKVATENAEQDLIGKLCHQSLHKSPAPCWSAGHDCPTQSVFVNGRSCKTIHEHTDARGGKRNYEIIASPVKDASGTVQHVIELLRDVTERVETETEIVRKNKELTVLNNISGILNRSLKPDEIFTKVLDKLTGLLSMDGGGIFFLDEATKELVCQYHSGISDDYARAISRIRLGEDLPGKVAVTGQIITTSDISRDHRIERSMVKHSGIRGYCCIPVKGKERIIGVFCLFSFSPHVFTPEEESILLSVGEMTGMALENIRLYEKLRSMYERQQKRWDDEHRQLLTLSSKLGAEVGITDIMNQVLGLMKQTFRADFIWMLVNDPSGNFVLSSSTQVTGKEGGIIYAADVSSLEKFALSKRQTVPAPDIRGESRFYLSPEVSAYHAAVAMPMFIGEKPVGVITLYHLMQKDFKEEELHFLEIMANMISVALERSEYYIRAGREKELADTIIQSVTDGIITVDIHNRVISVNSAFERLAGVGHGSAVGKHACENFRYSDENNDFCTHLGECIEAAAEGSTTSRTSIMKTRFGGSIPVTINSSPILDRNGTVTGIVNLIRDVSREKELDRMKTELVRSVSHEFRTPLSAIVGMTEMLLQGDVEEGKVDKYLSVIRNEGLRLTKMVSELLSLSRIESGKETLHFRRIDVEVLLKDILDTLSTLAEGKGAIIKYALHDVRYIVGDEENLKQVFMNLIDNALTFSDKGCNINIDMKRNGDNVDITIADNGWGIPEEDLPHLTERFYRGKHGDRIKGTGLGLALCDEIVKMHGGTLSVQSVVGKGTAVSVSIPYREVL
jgi:PAS domain S-box-containing protein